MENSLEFRFAQGTRETRLLCALVNRILSISTIAAWFAFSLALTVMIALSVTTESQSYALPLCLLSGCMTVGIAIFLITALRLKPVVSAHILGNEQKAFSLMFSESGFELRSTDGVFLRGTARSIVGQYWCADDYILHVRISPAEGGRGDELYCIPLAKESFDSVYLLADALTAKKKRLVRIRLQAAPCQEDRGKA